MGKSYQVTDDGIIIRDRRQFTNGQITPNYVYDLYLPILEYDGIGLYFTICRMASLSSEAVTKSGLRKLFKLMPRRYEYFKAKIALMEELGLIAVIMPTGEERLNNQPSTIELLDPPTVVPQKYVDLVLEKTLNPFFFEVEREQKAESGVAKPQNEGSRSFRPETSEFPGGNRGCFRAETPSIEDHEETNIHTSQDVTVVEVDQTPKPKRKRKSPANEDSAFFLAVRDAWAQLIRDQASQGKRAPFMPLEPRHWKEFKQSVEALHQFARAQGWSDEQAIAYLLEFAPQQLKEVWWVEHPNVAYRLSKAVETLQSWWLNVKQPSLKKKQEATSPDRQKEDEERQRQYEHIKRVTAKNNAIQREQDAKRKQKPFFQTD